MKLLVNMLSCYVEYFCDMCVPLLGLLAQTLLKGNCRFPSLGIWESCQDQYTETSLEKEVSLPDLKIS